jgi:uncharacterized membrane protein HdeD (DUF308 family)
MAVQTGPTTSPPSYASYEEDRGQGWVILAGVLLLTVGVFNMIDGIAAISKSHFFVADTRYVFGDLNAWGWVALCLGVLQLLVGFGVFAKNQFARWTGIALLSISAIAALLYMPTYPFWSLCLFAVDILAIYGLAAYGKRIAE